MRSPPACSSSELWVCEAILQDHLGFSVPCSLTQEEVGVIPFQIWSKLWGSPASSSPIRGSKNGSSLHGPLCFLWLWGWDALHTQNWDSLALWHPFCSLKSTLRAQSSSETESSELGFHDFQTSRFSLRLKIWLLEKLFQQFGNPCIAVTSIQVHNFKRTRRKFVMLFPFWPHMATPQGPFPLLQDWGNLPQPEALKAGASCRRCTCSLWQRSVGHWLASARSTAV